MTHPAALVARLPKIIIPIKIKGGFPPAAKNKAHKAGMIKINLPDGLSHRNSLTILPQIDSLLISDLLIILPIDYFLLLVKY
jgi:hypothetical protein